MWDGGLDVIEVDVCGKDMVWSNVVVVEVEREDDDRWRWGWICTAHTQEIFITIGTNKGSLGIKIVAATIHKKRKYFASCTSRLKVEKANVKAWMMANRVGDGGCTGV